MTTIDKLKFNVFGLSVSQWQPIDTAPKDATIILYNGDVGEGSFVVSCEHGQVNSFVFTCDHTGLDGYYADPCCPQPTHWMPLPPPPT